MLIRFPSAQEAAEWEQLSSGSVVRFLAILESQTVKRVEADLAAQREERELARLSLWMAFSLSAILAIAAIVFFALRIPLAGGLLLGVPATGVAIAFVPKAIADRKSKD